MAAASANGNTRLSALFFAADDRDVWPAVLLALCLVLVGAGLVMVYSASMVSAMTRYRDPAFFLKRQAVFAAVGMAVLVVTARAPLGLMRRLTAPLLIASFVGLVVCLTPLATSVKGASRWISIGSFHLQPSELAKLAIIFYVADALGRKGEKIRAFSVGFLPPVVVALVFAALCIKEPDLGAAVMILLLCFSMLFVGGTRLGYILVSGIALLPALAVAITTSSYRMKRFMAFLNPELDIQGQNYQIYNSLLGIGSGRIWGSGIGEGNQKLLFLPDAHTDFIASIVGEELGLLGIAALVLLFGLLVYAGIRIALRCREPYPMYMAAGISFFIAFQAAINMGVVMGLLPTKGMTLPFLSYGGSSLLVNLFAVGVLLAVSRQSRQAADGGGG